MNPTWYFVEFDENVPVNLIEDTNENEVSLIENLPYLVLIRTNDLLPKDQDIYIAYPELVIGNGEDYFVFTSFQQAKDFCFDLGDRGYIYNIATIKLEK